MCNQDFSFRPITRYEWLFCLRLDPLQEQYVLDNYKQTLCQECIKTIYESFYAISVNPAYIKHKNKL